MRRLAVLLAALLGSNAHAATVADWEHDLDGVADAIRLRHPDPFTKSGRLTFLRGLEALKADLPKLTEEQRMVAAMRWVASLGDGHTQLTPKRPDFGLWYPVRLYLFRDGLYVTSAHRSVVELAGAQVLEIGGRPAAQAIAEAQALRGADNAFGQREAIYALASGPLMRGLGLAGPDGRLALRVRLANGRVVDRVLTPSATDDPLLEKGDSTFEWAFRTEVFGPGVGGYADWVAAFRATPAIAFRTPDEGRPAHLMYRRAFISKAYPDAYYVQANVMNMAIPENFRKAMMEVDKLKPRRLILDFRYNFGGDGSKVAAMIAEFIRRQPDPPWKELYFITGRKTFSAGVMAADAFLDNTAVTVVGEPAASALNHYGDATSVDFTRVGLVLDVSTLRHQLGDSSDLAHTVPVDVPAEMSFADYVAGRDPAVDPILAGVEMRSIPVIALTDGGQAARRAFETRRTQFSAFPWWRAPNEFDLRRAAWRLMDAKRGEDAYELTKLTLELYPSSPRAWDNHGQAQLATERKTDALRSFACALAIDPNNIDSGDQKRALSEAGGPVQSADGCPGAIR